MLRWLAVLCWAFCSCAHSDRDRVWVRTQLAQHGIPALDSHGSRQLTADGVLDEDDVVRLALALNPTYQAELARIDASRADLEEASRLANPQLTALGALGPISSYATLLAPLDSLWQLPQRSELAARALDSVAEQLVQAGLTLARDARLAHTECGLAEQRVAAREQLADVLAQLARLADVRVRLGEASPDEAALLRAEASIASDALAASRAECSIAHAQLQLVLGLRADQTGLKVAFTHQPSTPPALPELVQLARSSRPDLRAAELAVKSALARTGWERSRVLAVSAQMEGHWTRPDQPAARLGGRIDLPIFNQNQGGIGRAKAELTRTTAALEALRQRLVFEIIATRTRFVQAQASLDAYRSNVLPPLDDARRVAMRNYELGEDVFVVVLQVLRRQGEAQLREAELRADWQRADAELMRAVGARIVSKP